MKPGFFAGCSNPDQMRALYRDLVKAHHPTGTRSRFNKNVELDDILASGVKSPRPEYRPISA